MHQYFDKSNSVVIFNNFGHRKSYRLLPKVKFSGMNSANQFKAFVYLIINRLFKITGNTLLFASCKGIKSFNQSISSDQFDEYPVLEEKTIGCNKLFLAYEGLRDNYTLLDRNVAESPHYGLVQALYKGEDILKTDYWKRALNGSLDMRYNQLINKSLAADTFRKKNEQVLENTYTPVKISLVNGRYYIIDGKHTAAVCLLNGVEAKCQLVRNPFTEEFFTQVYFRIKQKEMGYKNGIAFFAKIYKEDNEN